MRAHTDERPFVCGVCGRAFTRQHDRRTHEQLHNREMKWVCGGVLENGENWGCGRRYDRKSNLNRHQRSKIGRGCIKPTSDGDATEAPTGIEQILEKKFPESTRPSPQRTNSEHSAAKTSNFSEVSGVPSSQPNISQETTLVSIDSVSTRVSWSEWEGSYMFNNALELMFVFLGHTAAVHKLVMWPSVKALLHPHEYDPDYLMSLERQRKPTYASDPRDIPYPAGDSILSPSSLAHDGAGLGNKSNADEISILNAEALFTDSCVEIDESGVFKLSKKTSRRYYQSYLDRMHKLHPFLDEQELDMKVEAFLNCYSPDSRLTTGTKHCHAIDCHAIGEVTGGLFDDPSSHGQSVELNIENAIILLIFALGAICESKYPASRPILDQRTDCHLSLFSGTVPPPTLGDSERAVNTVFSLDPLHCGPKVLATLCGPKVLLATLCEPLHPPSKPFRFTASNSKFGENGSRRMTHTDQDEYGNAPSQLVVPGLALYRLATATLGCLRGVFNLNYIHACLLAGLYAGQFADPLQSHVWINEAARACQLLLQRQPDEDMKDHTKERRKFAYWTCLQLESDLLAELDIPASGLSRFEDRMSLPKGSHPINRPGGPISPNKIMMMYYSSQVYLQKIHIRNQSLANCPSSVQRSQIINLELWRIALPAPLQWRDTDEPAKDINAARMRAVYYRIKYILHLPLLYHTVQYGHPSAWDDFDALISVDLQTGSTSTSKIEYYLEHARMKYMLSAMDSDTSNDALTSPEYWSPPTFDWKELPLEVRLECKTCLECAIQGLTVFDGIEDRFVIPNIFGTAHE